VQNRVVHCKRSKYDVYIGRPSKWGNPFTIGKHGTREEVIQKYREWILRQDHLLKALPELFEKTVACWCAPHACHGEVLTEFADKLQQHLQVTNQKSIHVDEIKEVCSK
jgi:hypothetical protein